MEETRISLVVKSIANMRGVWFVLFSEQTNCVLTLPDLVLDILVNVVVSVGHNLCDLYAL